MGVLYVVARVVGVPGRVLQRLWEFIGGAIIGYYAGDVRNFRGAAIRRSALVVATLILLVLSRLRVSVPSGYLPANFTDVLAAFSLTALAFEFGKWQSRGRLGKAAVYLGEISYGVYVWHVLPLAVFAPLVRRMPVSPMTYTLITFLLVFPSVLIISTLVYERFEKPGIAIGRRLSRRYAAMKGA